MRVDEGPFSPYNGTIYNLTGVLELDRNIVDINVTLVWMWSLNGNLLERQFTRSHLDRITISFQPLATNSSGLYHLNVFIEPDNPLFVEGNRGSSAEYNLVVLRKFCNGCVISIKHDNYLKFTLYM